MSRATAPSKTKTQPAAPIDALAAFARRWWGKVALLLLSTALLTFSFAPFNQFYLGWVALAPWLVLLRYCRSARTAFFWSWLGGMFFFQANMWWLAYVTGPGMAALMALLGLYWAVPGAIIRGTRLLEPEKFQSGKGRLCPGRTAASIFLIAAVWVGFEWLRGTWPLGGLAWLYLGLSQSPVLAMCQVADLGGVFLISFWMLLINGWVALYVLYRKEVAALVPAGIAVLALTAASAGYGAFRMGQKTSRPGPTVLVVQANYLQSNSGEKGASQQEIIQFHVDATEQALRLHPDTDLVVWSETMMPALNPSAREYAARLPSDYWIAEAMMMAKADADLTRLAHDRHTSLLVGGIYNADWTIKQVDATHERAIPLDRRNVAYYYTPSGFAADRYDKIHLVPFGEYLPFKSALPPLYKLFLSLSPYPEEYTLTAGSPDALTAFQLKPGVRFVTPICFEDMDGVLVRRMFALDGSGRKRAEFIVNITNDGWFKYNEMPQHLQAAVFRSIENRVPTARSVNTGISGFIDSDGRKSDLIPPGEAGTSVATISLDDRVTFYTRFGDVFACLCAGATGVLAMVGVIQWFKTRRKRKGSTS